MDNAKRVVEILKRNGLPVDKSHIKAFVVGYTTLLKESLAHKAEEQDAEKEGDE